MTQLLKTLFIPVALCVVGGLGGLVAERLGLPLPWMLGALLATSAVVIGLPRVVPADYRFPDRIRTPFIALIGVAIGGQITLDVLANLGTAVFSLAAITLFVPLVHWLNYLIFRHVGGYDPATAFFSGTPGGLMEAILMGEARGADQRLLTLQQFLRIICVVTLLPVGLSIWYGHPVGSAGGSTFAGADAGLDHLPEVLLIGALGLAVHYKFRVPAGQLVAPLIAGAVATLTELAVIETPGWTISLAQVVIGSSLGARFTGIGPRLLLRGTGLALLSVGAMMLVGGLLSFGLLLVMDEPFDVLLICFAPGGVTEMALVALSLNANPAFVTLHHIYRILLTVIEMTWSTRFLP